MFKLLQLENLPLIKAHFRKRESTIKGACYNILLFIYHCLQISQLTLTFKEIIFCYRKQPHCKPQVFRSVYVHGPSRSRSGVKLYPYFAVLRDFLAQMVVILKWYLTNSFHTRK
jgi:hypothetical protein